MRSNKIKTWLNYLDSLLHETGEMEHKEVSALVSLYNSAFVNYPFFRNNMPYTYILDYTKRCYLSMTDNFAGYSSECFTRNGLAQTLEIIHPRHLDLFNCKIFPARLAILDHIPSEEHREYVFSYTYLVRGKKGGFVEFLQKNFFISDDHGHPLFSVGILVDITDIHTDKRIIQTVHKLEKSGEQEEQLRFRKVFYINEEDTLISKREREILCLMSDGFSNKMIAEKLNISEKTVKRHRENMQDKTGASNGVALVGFAHRAGLI
ncbi:response regulator transcription factor [Pedobacter sp. L105]|uniref:response regulator transcription factor n=1 Tax=Pedobacter sp. L105 TaxID=1641871 RepID=UPI00131B6CF7|nr:response regulator transcription factor [Pedobacter sp. L105]